MSNIDYLIVGSGAAGSVLANRLSASGRNTVLLLEAGADLVPGKEPADIRSVFPLSAFNPAYIWRDIRVHWRTRDNSPAVPLPQGKILGGSSAIMGMWAMRGHPADYDEWAQHGASGWGWQDVLPYFIKLETDIDFDSDMHGQHGPLPIRRETAAERVPFARAIHGVAMAQGWADIADMNADFRDGHCALPVSREAQSRGSAGLHYLTRAVRGRDNLTVRADCLVERLIFAAGRVAGVEARTAAGLENIWAQTTIVAAGALQSPVLLMRSGIGPEAQLRAAGVPVVHDLRGVGANLQNHAALYMVGMLQVAGLDPPGLRPAGSTVLRWTSGVDETPPADMAMYVRSYLAWHALGRRMGSLAPCLMRPASRGDIRLTPEGRGSIAFNMLSDPRDMARLKVGMRMAVAFYRTLVAGGLSEAPVVLTEATGLARYNSISRLNALRAGAAALMLKAAPPIGRQVMARLAKMTPAGALVEDDAALTSFIEQAVSGTGHVCGTCRMGAAGDPLAVVDPAGHVHNVPGLVVGDASIMPNVPAANTHIPTIMVAEKIAAGLLA